PFPSYNQRKQSRPGALTVAATHLRFATSQAATMESKRALMLGHVVGTVANATPARRKRGPSLNRRTGQRGCIVQHSKTWDARKPCYGKFWVDTAEGRKRQSVALGICPTRTIARQRLRQYIDSEGVND